MKLIVLILVSFLTFNVFASVELKEIAAKAVIADSQGYFDDDSLEDFVAEARLLNEEEAESYSYEFDTQLDNNYVAVTIDDCVIDEVVVEIEKETNIVKNLYYIDFSEREEYQSRAIPLIEE